MNNYICPHCKEELDFEACEEAGESIGMSQEDKADYYCECTHDSFACPNEKEEPSACYDWLFFKDMREAFKNQDEVEFNRLLGLIDFVNP